MMCHVPHFLLVVQDDTVFVEKRWFLIMQLGFMLALFRLYVTY